VRINIFANYEKKGQRVMVKAFANYVKIGQTVMVKAHDVVNPGPGLGQH
jgi:hypothetical protein